MRYSTSGSLCGGASRGGTEALWVKPRGETARALGYRGAVGGFLGPDIFAQCEELSQRIVLFSRDHAWQPFLFTPYGVADNNGVYAGGDSWGVWRQASSPRIKFGVGSGSASTDVAIRDISSEGKIVFADGVVPGALAWSIPANEYARICGDVVVWQDVIPSRMHVSVGGVEVQIQTVSPQQWNGLGFRDPAGRLWLTYYGGDDWGSVLHPADDASHGYRLSAKDTFSIDVWFAPYGDCEVSWCDGEGEALETLQQRWFTLGQWMVALTSTVPVHSPVPSPLPPPTTTGGAYPRKMLFAPYKTHFLTEDTPPKRVVTTGFVGNTYFIDNAAFLPELPGPFIQSLSKINPAFLGPTLAYYMHVQGSPEQGRAEYEDALTRMDAGTLPEKPIIFYFDTRWTGAIPSWIDRARTWLSFPCYRNVGESLADFKAAMETSLERLGGETIPQVLTPAFYDRNFQVTLSEIRECLPLYDEWVRRYFIVGIMPFADMRPSGMVTYPVLREDARAMFAKIVGRPNRFDYWLPKKWKQILKDQKLDYEMLILRHEEKNYLRSLMP